jgi:hypothetical protein
MRLGCPKRLPKSIASGTKKWLPLELKHLCECGKRGASRTIAMGARPEDSRGWRLPLGLGDLRECCERRPPKDIAMGARQENSRG